jgi:hypothetical protein
VAVSSSGTGNRIMTSADGLNWTVRSSPEDLGWRSLCWRDLISPETGATVLSLAAGTPEDDPMMELAYDEGLLLGPLHGHRAALQLRRGGSQGETFEEGEPQSRGLGCRQLLHQLLQGLPGEGCLQRRLGSGSRQLIQQGVLASGGGIEAGEAQWAGAL